MFNVRVSLVSRQEIKNVFMYFQMLLMTLIKTFFKFNYLYSTEQSALYRVKIITLLRQLIFSLVKIEAFVWMTRW